MSIPVTIPRLGWSMDEGNFTGWLKKDGETVAAGEPLFTMESEKATQDIEATDSGILRLGSDSPGPGDVVKVGQIIGRLLAPTESGNDAASHRPPAASLRPVAVTTPGPESSTAGATAALAEQSPPAVAKAAPAISPRARRRAAELGVDAAQLTGSGRTGRVVEADVLKSAQTTGAPSPRPEASPPPVKTSVRRRLVAQRTATSFATIPHFYLRREVDATALLRLREDLLPEIEDRTGVRLSLTDFLLRAQARAACEVPAAHCVWVEDNLVRLPLGDVGLVVGLPEGLMIPVVRAAHEGDLASVVQQRATLVAAAKTGQLTQEQMRGGATSLSNLGNAPVDGFAAVISPNQSSMLAVGRAAPRPWVVAGRLAVRTTLQLCLSMDHRVLDGAPAAEFLAAIARLLEDPAKLV